MRPSDPRIRQTLNQISHNIESANLTTQASLFTFSERYINPCLASLGTCLEASCQPCYACVASQRDNRSRHPQRPRRGRDNFGFDFYDDWDEEEGDWGHGELDRLLAGPAEVGQQPRRNQTMSYGSRLGRKTTSSTKGGEVDPHVVPKSLIFGFLENLPWKIGGRGTRYRPTAADLQENVGRGRFGEAEPLMEESEESGTDRKRKHRRNRSDTVNSRSTTTSLSSRGDLFTSEGEDDAVLLDDDEFAMVLERRATGTMSDDRSSRKSRKKNSHRSRASTKTRSSGETPKSAKQQRASSIPESEAEAVELAKDTQVPSLDELQREEERIKENEERNIESKRQAAAQIAQERGLVETRMHEQVQQRESDHATVPIQSEDPAIPEQQAVEEDVDIPKEPE